MHYLQPEDIIGFLFGLPEFGKEVLTKLPTRDSKLTDIFDGKKYETTKIFHIKSFLFGNRWFFLQDYVRCSDQIIRIESFFLSNDIVKVEGQEFVTGLELFRLGTNISPEFMHHLFLTERRLEFILHDVYLIDSPLISGYQVLNSGQIVEMKPEDQAQLLSNSVRATSNNQPYLTLLISLYSDGWSPNKTKYNSFESFSFTVLNQYRESQKNF